MKNYRTSLAVPILLLFTLCFLPASVGAVISTVEGTVFKVPDGDTLWVETKGGAEFKISLYGCDAPEMEKRDKKTGKTRLGQPYSLEARQALRSKLYRKEVRVEIINIDRRMRMEAIVWRKKRNVNLEMVREGYAEAAWEYLKQPYYGQFLYAEQQAKFRKRGIWGLAQYERPGDYRKRYGIRGN